MTHAPSIPPAEAPARTPTPTPWLRHACHFGPLLALCAAGLALAWPVAPSSLPLWGAPQVAYAAVVALNILPLGMASWSAVLGAAVTLRGPGRRPAALDPAVRPPTGTARTAVIVPVYEESATRVFAAVAVMADMLARERAGSVEIFVLSDTRSEAGVSAEARAAARAAALRPDARVPIHYRRRADNAGRKAGNIADFCARWGDAHDFMVVLDADSLMSGAAIGRLIGAMEANPNAGLIQLMCYPVGRDSLFARLQQFNAWLYGPLFQRGVAFWQGPRGNYWGHNAILRIGAFAAHCGLPPLPGPAPFGGEIMSHDTVEAALLLRAGWDVWMLPDGGRADRTAGDGGARESAMDERAMDERAMAERAVAERYVESWEETPTNLLDHLGRDRRWCQGNLQHATVLLTDGLRVASLYHLTRGLLHYLSSILVLAWLALYAAVDRHGAPGAGRALVAMVVLLIGVPRVLGVLAALADGAVARRFGGRAGLVAGAALEQLFALLVYPVTLVFHAIFVFGALTGHVVQWDAQARDDRSLTWREAARPLAVPLLAALPPLALVAARAPLTAALLAPGLVLGVPLAVWSSRRGPGDWARRHRLFVTPDETGPHAARAAVEVAAARLASEATEGQPPALPPARGLPLVTQVLRRRAAAGIGEGARRAG